jgi:hypothetical protein
MHILVRHSSGGQALASQRGGLGSVSVTSCGSGGIGSKQSPSDTSINTERSCPLLEACNYLKSLRIFLICTVIASCVLSAPNDAFFSEVTRLDIRPLYVT